MNRLATVLAVWCIQTAFVYAEDAAQPNWPDARLHIEGRQIKPLAVVDGSAVVRPLNETTLIAASREKVDFLSAADGTLQQSVAGPKGVLLRLLDANNHVAFFEGFVATKDKDRGGQLEPEQPCQLRRLDLDRKLWLDPVPLAVEKEHTLAINAVAARDAQMIVLADELSAVRRDEFAQPSISGYTVTAYRGRCDGQAAPPVAWAHRFATRGKRPAPGVYLMASQMPDFASSDLAGLALLNGNLIVIGGEKDDVICLGPEGKEVWRQENIWEYQRGFIGPSVWSHYISRFGEDETRFIADGKDAEAKAKQHLADMRADFEKHFECAIVGGPYVVSLKDSRNEPMQRVFIAIARGPAAWNWGYLSECSVYEISEDGQVIAVTTLPTRVLGRSAAVSVQGDLIWACQKNRLAAIHAGEHRGSGMLDSDDLLCDVRYYTTVPTFVAPDIAWLTSDRVGQISAVASAHAAMVTGGGYIETTDRRSYYFPLSVVESATDATRSAVLRVPFDRDIPTPTEHFYEENGRVVTKGPYLWAITRLQCVNGLIATTVGSEHGSRTMIFKLPDERNVPTTKPLR